MPFYQYFINEAADKEAAAIKVAAEEAVVKKAAEEAAAKKAIEEAAAKKAVEEAAAKKAIEETAAKKAVAQKAAEEAAAAQRAVEEAAAAQRAVEEAAAAQRAVEEAAALKAAKEVAAQKAAEEAGLLKAIKEAAAQKAAQEAAAQKAAEETATQKAAKEAAAQKAAKEAAAQKAAEEAAVIKAVEKATKETALLKAAEEKTAEEAALLKATQEAAVQKAAEEAAVQKAAEETALLKAAEEAAAQKVVEEAASLKAVQKAAEEAAAQKAAEKAVAQKAADEAADKNAEYIIINVNISLENAMQLLSCVLHIPDGTPIKNDDNTYNKIKTSFTRVNLNTKEDQYNLKNLLSSLNNDYDNILDSLKTDTINFDHSKSTYTFLKNCNDKINLNTNDNNNDTDYYLDIVYVLALAIQYAVKAAIIERLTSLYNIIICFTTLKPQILLNDICSLKNNKIKTNIILKSLSIICGEDPNSWYSNNEEYGIDLKIMNVIFDNKKAELLTEIETLYQNLFLPLFIINKENKKIINVYMANTVKNVYYNDTLDYNKTRGIDTLMKYPLSLLTLSKALNEVSALFTRHALQLASDKIKSNILEPQKTNTLNIYFNITDKGETEKLNAAVQAINTLNQSQNVGSLKILKEQFNNMYNMLNINIRERNTLMELQKKYIDLDNALTNVKFNNMIHDDILKCPQILSAITEATFVIINAKITEGTVQNQIQKINAKQPKLSGFVQESLKKGGFRKTKYKKYTKKINKSIRQISGKYTKIIGGFRNTHTKQYTKKKYKKAKNIKQLIHNKS